jgi:hypothetical protein
MAVKLDPKAASAGSLARGKLMAVILTRQPSPPRRP